MPKKNRIERIFDCWGNLPWRKPLAMTVAVVSLVDIQISIITGVDIPPNTMSLLMALNGIIISWAYGTSAYESIAKSERAEVREIAKEEKAEGREEKEEEILGINKIKKNSKKAVL